MTESETVRRLAAEVRRLSAERDALLALLTYTRDDRPGRVFTSMRDDEDVTADLAELTASEPWRRYHYSTNCPSCGTQIEDDIHIDPAAVSGVVS